MLFGDNAEFSVAAQSCPYLKRASNATREIWATAPSAVPEDRPSNRPTRLADGLGLESNPGNEPHIAVRPVPGLIRGVGSPASDFRMEARFRLRSESAQMARLCQRHRKPTQKTDIRQEHAESAEKGKQSPFFSATSASSCKILPWFGWGSHDPTKTEQNVVAEGRPFMTISPSSHVSL